MNIFKKYVVYNTKNDNNLIIYKVRIYRTLMVFTKVYSYDVYGGISDFSVSDFRELKSIYTINSDMVFQSDSFDECYDYIMMEVDCNKYNL